MIQVDMLRIIIDPYVSLVMFSFRSERTVNHVNACDWWRVPWMPTRNDLYFMPALLGSVNEPNPKIRIGREGIIEV